MSEEVAGWQCTRCEATHPSNPSECWNCGHEIFEPLSKAEVAAVSHGAESPDSMEFDGQSPTASTGQIGASGPDVALDGSIATEDDESKSIWQRIKGYLPQF